MPMTTKAPERTRRSPARAGDVPRRNATNPRPSRPPRAADPGPSLSPQQARLLTELAAGATVTEAANRAGVHRATAHRWLVDAAFVAEYNRLRAEVDDAMRESVRALAVRSLVVVREVLDDPAAGAQARLKAAFGVLALASQLPPVGPVDPVEVALRRRREGLPGPLREFFRARLDLGGDPDEGEDEPGVEGDLV
jgi:hypothetical protein